MPSERDRGFVACFLPHTAAPKCVCARRLADAGHSSPAEFVNTAVRGPALDATVHRYVPRLCVFPCCRVLAGSCILIVLRLVTFETRQHSLPLPGCGSKGASLPYMVDEIVVATLFMVPRWLYQFFPLLLCAGCRWIPLVFASSIRFKLFQYKKKTKYRLGGNSPHHSR